jgi:hypothetical protein
VKLVKFPAFRPYTRAYGANVSKFTNFITQRTASSTRPHETRGNQHAMPCHDALAGARDDCVEAGGIGMDRKGDLFGYSAPHAGEEGED